MPKENGDGSEALTFWPKSSLESGLETELKKRNQPETLLNEISEHQI